LKVNKNILKNRRIFLSLNNTNNSNHYYLLNHGILFDNNPDNEVEINLFFNDFDPLINYRREVLKNADEPFVFRLKGNYHIDNLGMFLAFLRIVEATTKIQLKHELKYFINNAISIESEKKVFKKCELIFKSRLKNYDTKDDQDEKLMKSDFLTQNQKNSLKIRISEKKNLCQINRIC